MQRIILLATIVGCFFLPRPVLAVETPPEAPAIPIKCAQGQVPVEEYVSPACPNNSTCETITGTAVGDTYNWRCSVPNHVEWREDGVFIQYSGGQFTYKKQGDVIKFLQDTVWGGFNCTDGAKAMYRVYTGPGLDYNSWGSEFLKTSMTCGQIATNAGSTIRTYAFDERVLQDYKFDLSNNVCNVKDQSNQTTGGATKLFFQGTVKCCTRKVEAIGVQTTAGPGLGETFFYCKGFGLCAHYQTLDLSGTNDPTTWTTETDVCNLKRTSLTPDPYYLYPIPGLIEDDAATLSDSLVKQGYQVSCGTPQVTLMAKTGGSALQYVQPGTVTLSPGLTSSPDYSSVKTPVWRGEGRLDQRYGSLETFWGYKDLTYQDELTRQIASAPIYSQLTTPQQCFYQVKILETIDKMCQKLENPATCALYKEIPGFEGKYTTGGDGQSLLTAFKSTFGYVGNDEKNLAKVCAKISSADLSAVANGSAGIRKEVAAALSNTPLYLDKAYRLAFLVVTIEQKNQVTAPGAPATYFNFLSNDPKSVNKHVVKVIAFKVPDFISNKDETSDIYYTDPMILTKQVIQDQSGQKNFIEKRNEFKRRISSIVRKVQGLFGAPPIECGGDCGSPTVQALVDIINANNFNCDANPKDLLYEESGEIADSGSTASSAGTTFTPENGGEIISQLKKQQIAQTAKFDFMAPIKPNVPGDAESKIKSYLIYPYGNELEDVEDTLLGYLLPAGGEATFKTDPNNRKYFKLVGAQNNISSPNDSYKFDASVCGLPPNADCSVNASVVPADDANSQGDKEPRIPGAWLGGITRLFQKSENILQSQNWRDIDACKTTEDFLLGRCKGKKPDEKKTNLACTPFEGGYTVESGDLRSVMQEQANQAGIQVSLLNVMVAGENCKHSHDYTNLETDNLNLCTKTDSDYNKGNYLEPGKIFMYNNPARGRDYYFRNCPKERANSEFIGPFVVTDLSYSANWNNHFTGRTGDPCSVTDNIQAMADSISHIDGGKSADPAAMRQFMVRYVLGGGAKVAATGQFPTCQDVMTAEQTTPVSNEKEPGTDDIKKITYGADNTPTKREWLWAVDNYCCAIDKANGINSNFCGATTDTWMGGISKVTPGVCKQ